MPHAIVILADGFEEIEAVTVIDLLRRAGVKVTTLGLDGMEARGAHGMTVLADKLFGGFREPFDAVVLPGGGPGTKKLAASSEVVDLVRSAHAENKLCAAICAAPTVFGKAGILDARKATCYPGCEGQLTGALVVEDAVVVDENVITSRAVGTAIPFALEVIGVLVGDKIARDVSSGILY